MQNKPTILLCWGYHRKGWIVPFEKLKEHFRFVFLYYIDKAEEKACFTDQERIYWGNYESAQQILEEVKPDKVVLMSINSGRTIALNAMCQRAGIPTYILQHGLFQNYAFYRNLEKTSRKQKNSLPAADATIAAPILNQKASALGFLYNSLGPARPLALAMVVLHTLLARQQGIYFADRHVRFPERMPDLYICYTQLSTTIHKELDRCPDSKIRLIGNPEFDDFFTASGAYASEPAIEKYYLLIDQPFADNQYYDMGISRDDMNTFYGKLSEYCRQQGAKLYIKLHPETYKDTWLLQNDTIVYYRDADVVSLVMGAKACFGTFSSLLIPAIYFKPCCIFKVLQSPVQEDLIQSRMVTWHEFKTFAAADIDFDAADRSEANMGRFVEKYLYRTDGKAIDRLQQILAC